VVGNPVLGKPVLGNPALLGCPQHRPDDVLVPGTPADLPGYRLAHLGGGGVGVVVEQPPRGQHHAGRAEAALQPVALGEGLLHRAQPTVGGTIAFGQPLDRRDLAVDRGYGEQQARPHRPPIHQHGAGTADAVLAADVGAGQAEVVTQCVGEQAPGGHP
jgi:hypothetical protein